MLVLVSHRLEKLNKLKKSNQSVCFLCVCMSEKIKGIGNNKNDVS